MKWGIVDPNNLVLNIIIYDGTSPYSSPDGCALTQVNNWVSIGDNQFTSEPLASVVE